MNAKEQKGYRNIFLVLCGVSFLSFETHSNYNCSLGLFSYFMWSDTRYNNRHRILWLLVFTAFVDLGWLIIAFLSPQNISQTSSFFKIDTNTLSQISKIGHLFNLLLKITFVIYAKFMLKSCQDLFTTNGLQNKFLMLSK